MITFRVMDKKTGKKADIDDILRCKWAKEILPFASLFFYLGEDGKILLVDDCDNCITLPEGRFYAEIEEVQP